MLFVLIMEQDKNANDTFQTIFSLKLKTQTLLSLEATAYMFL